MDRQEFDRHCQKLSAHLTPLRPAFQEACDQYEFEFSKHGWYPHIRIRQEKGCNRWVQLDMSFDENGRYRDSFHENVPHSLAAGVFIDVRASSGKITRYSNDFTLWDSVPFHWITVEKLTEALHEVLPRLLCTSIDSVIHDDQAFCLDE